MPADSRQKRFSLISMGRPWMTTLPVPDGTIGTTDRLQLDYRYAASLSVAPAAGFVLHTATFTDLDTLTAEVLS